MTLIAPALQGFFTDRLIGQRNASPHTVAAYRDTFRLLLTFASHDRGLPASQLRIDDLGPTVIAAFLDDLEIERGNSAATRNARLAAIHSLFRYAALHHPDHAATIQQVLAIPPKRCERTIVTFLTEPEIDALLSATSRATRTGRRDHALLMLAVQTGLRVTELISLTGADVHLGTAAHVSCHGKGRKQRITPLTRGSPSALVNRTIRCSRHAPDIRSVATPSNIGSRSTPTLPNGPARHWHPKRSRRTRCGTPPRCSCFTPESTPA